MYKIGASVISALLGDPIEAMEDAAMGAFSVFFTQCASFLEYQQEMKRHKGRSNAESLFELVNIPSDSQIRALLDGVEPK